MAKEKKKKRSYEEAFAELAAIVEELESGRTPLEESLEKYEKGVRALKECYDALQAAEKKIVKLAKDTHGKLGEFPLKIDTGD